MTKKVTTFFLLTLQLFSLELTINTAIENKKPYCVVNLTHEEPFMCVQKNDVYGNVTEIVCEFAKSPANRFTRSENSFFKIGSDVQNGKFIVKLKPKKNSLLMPVIGSFKDKMLVWEKKPDISDKWQIIGFDKELPFVTPKKSEGINFPIAINSFSTPAIGALDIAKRPLMIEEGRDVPIYLAIKNEIDNEQYTQALYDTDDAIKSFPDSIFSKEFLFFKAKALYNLPNLEREEDIIEIGKAWIKKYPSDEAVSEVLLMLAVSYNKLGLANESNYYFDRIFSEHAGEKHEKLAKIAFGDVQMQKGNTKKALDLYSEALTETDDLQVASIAATKIAQKQLESGDIKQATENYEKVFNANPEFILKDKNRAFELAKTLADKGSFLLASKIAKGVRDRTERQDVLYDTAFKDAAYWLEMSQNKKDAYTMYKDYLNTFPSGGEYDDFVKERLDRLFFEMSDLNKSAKLERLDTLMGEYPGGEVHDMALMEKARLYFDDKNYSAVLGIKQELLRLKDDENGTTKGSEAKKVLYESAKNIAEDALQKDDCKKSLLLKMEYNLSIDKKYDRKLFDCAKRSAAFALAQELASSHLEEKDLKERLFWLYESAKIYHLSRDFNKTKSAADDAFILAETLNETKYYDILYELAFSQRELGELDGMLKSAKKIEILLPKNAKSIELFKSIADYAMKRKDELLASEYAKKALELQKELKINLYSPSLDILYAEALIRLNMFDNALAALLEIDTKSIGVDSSAKVYYWMGFVYQKLEKQLKAKESYQKCGEINSTSPWVSICRDALKLFE